MQTGIIFDIKRYAIHDGPGIRTTVFMKGCPLMCRWCHNPEGISPEPEILYRSDRCGMCDDCITACPEDAIFKSGELKQIDRSKCTLCGDCIEVCVTSSLEIAGNEISSSDLMKEIERDLIFFDESGGGVTFSGGEPMLQLDFLDEMLTLCRKKEIHTTVDTSGFSSSEAFERILDRVDLFLFDLKTVDNKTHKEYTGISNIQILNNLKLLAKNDCNINIRFPVISGVNDSDEHIKSLTEFLAPLNNVNRIDLLPYHNWGVAKYSRMSQPKMKIDSFPDNNGRFGEVKSYFETKGFKVHTGG
jgi:pyruvate formate lyase activating enzyme